MTKAKTAESHLIHLLLLWKGEYWMHVVKPAAYALRSFSESDPSVYYIKLDILLLQPYENIFAF